MHSIQAKNSLRFLVFLVALLGAIGFLPQARAQVDSCGIGYRRSLVDGQCRRYNPILDYGTGEYCAQSAQFDSCETGISSWHFSECDRSDPGRSLCQALPNGTGCRQVCRFDEVGCRGRESVDRGICYSESAQCVDRNAYPPRRLDTGLKVSGYCSFQEAAYRCRDQDGDHVFECAGLNYCCLDKKGACAYTYSEPQWPFQKDLRLDETSCVADFDDTDPEIGDNTCCSSGFLSLIRGYNHGSFLGWMASADEALPLYLRPVCESCAPVPAPLQHSRFAYGQSSKGIPSCLKAAGISSDRLEIATFEYGYLIKQYERARNSNQLAQNGINDLLSASGGNSGMFDLATVNFEHHYVQDLLTAARQYSYLSATHPQVQEVASMLNFPLNWWFTIWQRSFAGAAVLAMNGTTLESAGVPKWAVALFEDSCSELGANACEFAQIKGDVLADLELKTLGRANLLDQYSFLKSTTPRFDEISSMNDQQLMQRLGRANTEALLKTRAALLKEMRTLDAMHENTSCHTRDRHISDSEFIRTALSLPEEEFGDIPSKEDAPLAVRQDAIRHNLWLGYVQSRREYLQAQMELDEVTRAVFKEAGISLALTAFTGPYGMARLAKVSSILRLKTAGKAVSEGLQGMASNWSGFDAVRLYQNGKRMVRPIGFSVGAGLRLHGLVSNATFYADAISQCSANLRDVGGIEGGNNTGGDHVRSFTECLRLVHGILSVGLHKPIAMKSGMNSLGVVLLLVLPKKIPANVRNEMFNRLERARRASQAERGRRAKPFKVNLNLPFGGHSIATIMNAYPPPFIFRGQAGQGVMFTPHQGGAVPTAVFRKAGSGRESYSYFEMRGSMAAVSHFDANGVAVINPAFRVRAYFHDYAPSANHPPSWRLVVEDAQGREIGSLVRLAPGTKSPFAVPPPAQHGQAMSYVPTGPEQLIFVKKSEFNNYMKNLNALQVSNPTLAAFYNDMAHFRD